MGLESKLVQVESWDLDESIPAELNAGVIVAPKAKQNPPNKVNSVSISIFQTTYPSDQKRPKRMCFQE
jgi:hypothetical protein